MWNYGTSAKFLVSLVKDTDTVGFLSFFFQVLLEQLIKFLVNSMLSLLTSPKNAQSQLGIQKLIRPLLLLGGGGEDHLSFAIPLRGVRNI